MKSAMLTDRWGQPERRERIRQVLRDADVYSIGIAGGPGCGKTTLLDATITRLLPEISVGVLVCDRAF
ncbi:MAG: hypothetical protein NZ561_04345, partial [Phycisphaerae bacterium]|nr:hypothetical protein [Phycisphaerae bacterium]MDW8263380.1 hypothetical protein [Phycisphaerales bacterium]